MAYLGGLVGLSALLLWVFCIVDILTTDDDACHVLPRWAWLLVVLLVPVAGALLWLAVGRPRAARTPRRAFERAAPTYPEYDRPGRFAASDDEADEEFLRRCRERAEEQRRRARGDP